jgi:hypothetical protein
MYFKFLKLPRPSPSFVPYPPSTDFGRVAMSKNHFKRSFGLFETVGQKIKVNKNSTFLDQVWKDLCKINNIVKKSYLKLLVNFGLLIFLNLATLQTFFIQIGGVKCQNLFPWEYINNLEC